MHYRWVGSCTLTCLAKRHYKPQNAHCHGARALLSSTDEMLLFPCAGTRKPSLSVSPATSLVRPVSLFKCGQDTGHAPVKIQTQKVLPAAEHARHQCYLTALQPSVVLLQTMALKISCCGKHQMRLVPARYVAKAPYKGEAM